MTAPTPSPETAEAISDAELRKIEQDARAAAECWAVPPRAGIWGNGTVQSLIARIRRAEAEIAALKARVMPEPRRYETVTEIEALQDGTYWVALDRMRDTILPWNLFLRIGGDWVWHGDDINEGNADMIGAWIVGPLPLPTLPTEETDPNG